MAQSEMTSPGAAGFWEWPEVAREVEERRDRAQTAANARDGSGYADTWQQEADFFESIGIALRALAAPPAPAPADTHIVIALARCALGANPTPAVRHQITRLADASESAGAHGVAVRLRALLVPPPAGAEAVRIVQSPAPALAGDGEWDTLIESAGRGAWPSGEYDAHRAAVAALPVAPDLRRLVMALAGEAYDAGARDHGNPEPEDLSGGDYSLELSPAALRLLRYLTPAPARQSGAADARARAEELRHTRTLLALAYLELGHAPDPRTPMVAVNVGRIQPREHFDGSKALRPLTDAEVDTVIHAARRAAGEGRADG